MLDRRNACKILAKVEVWPGMTKGHVLFRVSIFSSVFCLFYDLRLITVDSALLRGRVRGERWALHIY